eukprot:2861598-Rhodomonas_salina.2
MQSGLCSCVQRMKPVTTRDQVTVSTSTPRDPLTLILAYRSPSALRAAAHAGSTTHSAIAHACSYSQALSQCLCD